MSHPRRRIIMVIQFIWTVGYRRLCHVGSLLWRVGFLLTVLSFNQKHFRCSIGMFHQQKNQDSNPWLHDDWCFNSRATLHVFLIRGLVCINFATRLTLKDVTTAVVWVFLRLKPNE